MTAVVFSLKPIDPTQKASFPRFSRPKNLFSFSGNEKKLKKKP
jgi:hypothetical protein